jgi:hypothetical protein
MSLKIVGALNENRFHRLGFLASKKKDTQYFWQVAKLFVISL